MVYGFTDEELAELSKWMLYYVIELKKDNKGFDKKRINSYLRQHNIILNSSGKISNKAKHNTIEFKDTESSICVSFIKHLRNSFAHGLIKATNNEFILKDQKKVRIKSKDENQSKNKKYNIQLTMYGKIDKTFLFDLLSLMKRTRQKQN